MKRIAPVLLLIFPLMLVPHLGAQCVAGGAEPGNAPSTKTFWVTAGMGVGASLSRDRNSSSGPVGLASGAFKSGSHLFSTRAIVTVGVEGESLAFWEVGGLYGRSLGRPAFHGSASVGLGLLGGERWDVFGGPPQDLGTNIGIPIELQASWRPMRSVAGALLVFGHMGRDHGIGGAVLGVQVGRMWP